MRTKGAPSDSRFSHFRCEEATIVDVDRQNWTVRVITRFTDKEPDDVQILSPYLHHVGGEGFHHLPEPGATCYVAFPNDNTPAFIMGYKGVAGVVQSESTEGEGGSAVSFRSRRPRMDPGDIGITGRDGNFIMMRRGGVVEVGATALAQRIYLPMKNYIKDFCENYEMQTLAGDVAWTVSRVENDPSGNAPASYVFHMNEYAQDAKASVRITHYPPPETEGTVKVATEITIAPSGIDRETGEVTGAVYRLSILSDGSVNELTGERAVKVEGSDTLEVSGDIAYTASGDVTFDAGGTATFKGTTVVLDGRTLLGGSDAASPGVRGDKLVQWLAQQVWTVSLASMTAVPSPASATQLQRALSTKVFLK
jgi:hypothetical protein